VKLAVGQTWCMRMPDNRAYFLITRHAEERRGWLALALSLGVGWRPWQDGDEVLFHVGGEDVVVESEHLELVCDAAALASQP